MMPNLFGTHVGHGFTPCRPKICGGGIKPRPTITGICQALICCKGGAWDEHLDYRADIQRG